MTIERPGDRPITNVLVNGRLWAAVTDEILLEQVSRDPKKLTLWAGNVIQNLLNCLKDGVDIWDAKLEDTKHDFLMRCAP